jgi:tetratricopeptide (TPR) repeat protein
MRLSSMAAFFRACPERHAAVLPAQRPSRRFRLFGFRRGLNQKENLPRLMFQLSKALIIAALTARVAFTDQSGAFKTLEAKSHFQKARQAIEGDDWNVAVLELNRALRYEPSNPEILTQLGVAYGELRKWDQAVKLLRKAVALAPGSVSAHYNLGVTLDRAKPGTGAGVAEYKKALQLKPHDVNSLVNLAVALGDQDSSQARKLLAQAQALEPNNAEAHFNLGLLQRNSGDSKGAVQAFEKAISLNPELLEARRQLALLLVSEQRWDENITQCREVLKRDPSDWNTRYSLGQALIRRGLDEEGRKEVEKAREIRSLEQSRLELERLLGRGVSNLTKGKTDEAIQDFRSALEMDGGSSMAHTYYGMGLAAGGRLEAGLEELDRALQLDPKNDKAHHNRGTVLIQMGRISDAKLAFEKGLALAPYFPETHNNLGLILSQTGQTEKAIEHFRLASELNPEYVEALFNLGLALRSLNRIDEAVGALRRAATLAPNHPQVQQALNICLKEQGARRPKAGR